jgi:chromosome partitioning protein
VTTVSIVGKQIRDELRKLSAKYDTIIVDSGARDSITQRAALSVAQTVLLPFPPRGPDLWTLDAVVQTIADIRMINETLRGIAFVNRADPFGHDNDEAEEAFAEHAGIIEAAPVRVGNRKARCGSGIAGVHDEQVRQTDEG